jgi:hypothetical protein
MAAYLAAGMLYVSRDLRQAAWNRPGYTQSPMGRWTVRLLWLPITFRMLWLTGRMGGFGKYLRREALPSYVTVVVLGVGLSYLTSVI